MSKAQDAQIEELESEVASLEEQVSELQYEIERLEDEVRDFEYAENYEDQYDGLRDGVRETARRLRIALGGLSQYLGDIESVQEDLEDV